MAEFFAELKRRHIYRVGAAYLVLAWTLAQFIDMLSQVFDLPPGIARPAVILLAIGFPVALVAAWTIEGKPHQAIASAVRARNTTVDWALFGGLAIVTVLIGYQQLTSRSTFIEPPGKESASPATAVAIAVLPLSNLSGEVSQEFFSDGLTEEITAALAKVPDLRVVGRTSAFQFKGQNQDLRAIGRALSATHLLEGSVRKDGNRLRITSQLIKADDGTHLWAENYDRQLTDIFAIQEEIALAIAAALRMPLGLQPGGTLVSSRDIDPESYEQYLSARAIIRTSINRPGAAERRIAAIGTLEQVVARHPGFAPAWAQLALGYVRRGIQPLPGDPTVEERRRLADEWLPKAEAAARRAIELDPNLADGYSQLAVTIALRSRDPLRAEELYSKALALDPFHPETMHFYAILLGAVGRVKEALAMRERLKLIDPLVGVYNSNYEEMLWVDGQTDALNARVRDHRVPPVFLARMYAAEARYIEAADALMAIPEGRYPEGMAEAAARLLRAAPVAAAPEQSLPRLDGSLEGVDFVYLHVGAPGLVIQAYEDSMASGVPNFVAMVLLWHPSYAPTRKTERFKAYVAAVGLEDYWRAKGWPEFCRPIGADDFACN